MATEIETTTKRRRKPKTASRRQATPKERQLIHLLANLGCSQARYGFQHSTSKGAISPEERLHLAEWHFLRLQQIRRIERSLDPVANLKRVYFKSKLSPRALKSLKIVWVEDGKEKVKRVNPELDDVLSLALDRGDTLKQLFYIVTAEKRLFSLTPDRGKIPLWVKEWEDSNYEVNFFPPSFPAWAKIVDD
ncbi:MAG: hypothetical protein F6J93_35835 [Oscillatoria sp. SIO1A7]|nr:hypothetical protein [Oscillatoria sp. SIO1A7]